MLQKLEKNIKIDPEFTRDLRIAIVRTDYHAEFNDNLEDYARETLLQHGVDETHIETFSVPGAWEIPLMAQTVAETRKFQAIIAFGVIIKGETHHFDMIAGEVGRILMSLSLAVRIPVALEILAVYDRKHAEARAGKNEQNKGIEGATAVLKMLAALKKVK